MRKYKYLIASTFLIILMIFIFIPSSSEKIYILFDKNEIQCDLNRTRENLQKDSYLLCEDLKFINFMKNLEKEPTTLNLKTLENLKITSNNYIKIY